MTQQELLPLRGPQVEVEGDEYTVDFSQVRCRAKRDHLKTFQRLLPGGQGQNLALTVSCVPNSLDIGLRCPHSGMPWEWIVRRGTVGHSVGTCAAGSCSDRRQR